MKVHRKTFSRRCIISSVAEEEIPPVICEQMHLLHEAAKKEGFTLDWLTLNTWPEAVETVTHGGDRAVTAGTMEFTVEGVKVA